MNYLKYIFFLRKLNILNDIIIIISYFLRGSHTVTLFNTLSGKLTVEGQTEAHIDILPCNSFQHFARHTLFISRCSDLIR